MSHTRRAKILEITSYPPPRAGWGVRVEHVKRQLEAMGHECLVLNIGKSRKIKSAEYLDVQSGMDYFWKVLRYSLKGYTVHMHVNGDSPKGFALTLLSELINLCCGRRCYLTFHAGPVQRYFPMRQSRALIPLFWLIFMIPRVIICNSLAVKEQIISYGIPADKIVPISAFSKQYLCFRTVKLHDRVEDFFNKWDPVISSYVFFRPEFYIGSLIEAVNRLVQRFPRLGLVVIGSDMGSDPIVRQVRSLGLQERILFCGDLPHDDFLTAVMRSKLFIRTPKKDGVCSSVLEALSLKVPVVASENGTRPPSVVTFLPDNADDLAEKVSYVLNHYEEVKQGIIVPEIRDTVIEEANLLIGVKSLREVRG